MRGVVITGGEKPPVEELGSLLEGAWVVAADSGLDYCVKYHIEPDCIVGDMDSLSSPAILKAFDPAIVRRYSPDKDWTDTELALAVLEDRECRPRVILGGGGGRMDHFLAIFALFDREQKPDLWLTGKEVFQLIHQDFLGLGELGEEISFFPTGQGGCRMSSQGLKWPLDGLTWSKGRGDLGISNLLEERAFSIKMEEGALLMVRSLKMAGKFLESSLKTP